MSSTMSRFRNLTAVWLFIPLISLYPADKTIKFDHLTREDGLSSSTVYSIIEDDLGFLWFGTPDGLNKFDGQDFTVYKSNLNDPGAIPNSNAGNLFIDQEGIIWIGTWGGGLIRLDPQSEKFTDYVNDPDNEDTISGNRVQTLFQDSQGTYWFGTYEEGLNSYSSDTGLFESYKKVEGNITSLSHNRVWSILEDKNQTLWIGTSEGLNRMNGPDKSFKLVEGTESYIIRTMLLSEDNHLWFGTNDGLFIYDSENDRLLNTPFTDRIYSLFEDSKEIIWIGTAEGLVRYDNKKGLISRFKHVPEDYFSLTGNSIRVVFEDSSGEIWIGTDGGGICRFNNNPRDFAHYYSDKSEDNYLISNNVFAFTSEDENNIWIGTKEGLQLWNQDSNEFFTYLNEEIRALERGPSGDLWVGSRSGLLRYNRELNKFHKYDFPISEIRTLLFDRQGVLWIGTYKDGIYTFDPKKGNLDNLLPETSGLYKLNHREIWDIFEDSSGNIWIGTGNGLNMIEVNRSSFHSYKIDFNDSDSLLGIRVFSIAEDRNGRIWVGTDEGLNLWYSQSDSFLRFTTQNGLADKAVKSILVDNEGFFWLGSNDGISRYNPESGDIFIYDAEDNLQGREFNVGAAVQLEDGSILLGGLDGFNHFNPQQIGTNIYNPPIVLTGFSVKGVNKSFDKSISYIDRIDLTYRENFFTFKFKALDFTSGNKSHYAYRLDGVDENWVYISDRTHVSYTNIDGGSYLFHVKAANRDHVWGENELLIKIQVTSPPWESWWAYISYILFFLMILTFLLSWRLRYHRNELQRQKLFVEKLEEKVLERTVELKLVNNKLERLSSMDDLTSLYNRRYFEKKYKIEWNRLQRVNLPLSVLMCDIDHFKFYNDYHGHQAGDRCIKLVARIITEHCVRPIDLAVRYGGEEFLIILPQTDSAGAASVAESIRSSIEKEEMKHGYSPVSNFVTISIGVATIVPSTNESPLLLIEQADKALYTSKNLGRNQIRIF